jgi:hypothetical protein
VKRNQNPILPVGAVDPGWYAPIGERTSRRRFDGRPVPPDALGRLHALCLRFRPGPRARLAIVDATPPELFTGLIGSYGAVKGAPSAALFIATEDGQVQAGYAGEALILEATRLGVGTCWLAGSFGKELAQTLVYLAPGERVVAVTPLGLASAKLSAGERTLRGVVRSSARKPVEELAPTMTGGSWPTWATTALEAARLAPSGANGQPWRFRMEDGALVLSGAPKPYWTAPLDYGIAMLHAELGALEAGVSGAWETDLSAPDVALFRPAG